MRDLIAEGARIYDGSPDLRRMARDAAGGGFEGGARWMAAVMGEIRGTAPPAAGRRFLAWALLKYSLCLLPAAAGGVAALVTRDGWWVLAGVPGFYLVEAPMVFLFPALVDGARRPLVESAALCARSGGVLPTASRVLRIGASMVGGGFAGRGFLRSWCVGCAAVVVWYERVRQDGAAGAAGGGA